MDFTFTDEQKAIRDGIIRFAQAELTPGSLERDEAHVFSKDLWLRCGDMGLQGLPVPAEYGGAGMDPLTTVIALEALGYGCEDGGLVFSICAHLLACVVPIWKHEFFDGGEVWIEGATANPADETARLEAVHRACGAPSAAAALGTPCA